MHSNKIGGKLEKDINNKYTLELSNIIKIKEKLLRN
jgi:hypothetical protein